MANHRWTTGDALAIAAMWGKYPESEIAAKLGVTAKSVHEFAVRRMGLPRDVEAENHRLRWETKDDRALLLMHMRGVPADEIARCIGRSERAVKRRIGELYAQYQQGNHHRQPDEGPRA